MFPSVLKEKYKVSRKLGEGGMGVIYLATQLDLDRPVAIKLLDAAGFSENEVVGRFSDEAKVCSRLNHKNIVQIYDYDVECSTPYMVLEYVQGETLKSIIEGGKNLSVSEILNWCAQICDGIGHAHSLGVTHRDLKPDNIIIDPTGQPRILDFGLAKMTGTTSVKTKTGIVVGTPLYMSPEQASGKQVQAPSDMYSFGVILFEMLAGTPPFDGETDMDIVLKHIKSPAPYLSDFLPGVEKNLEKVCLKLLEKSPSSRTLSAEKTARYLRQLSVNRGSWNPEHLMVTLGEKDGQVIGCPIGERPVPQKGTLESSVSSFEKGDETRASLKGSIDRSLSSHKRTLERSSMTSRSSVVKGRRATREDSPLKSSSISKLSRFSQESTIGALAAAGNRTRKIFAGACLVIIALVGVYLGLSSGHTTATASRIYNFDAFGGSRAVLVTWAAEEAINSPTFVICKVDGKNTEEVFDGSYSKGKPSIEPFENESGKALFRHTVIVSDLPSAREYTISLVTGESEEQTLPRSFSTRGINPERVLRLTSNGDLLLDMGGTIPFSCELVSKELTLEGKPLVSGTSYYRHVVIKVDFEKVKADYAVLYRLTTIDGANFSSDQNCFQMIDEVLVDVFKGYRDSRKMNPETKLRPVFAMWQKNGKENALFSEKGNYYAKSDDPQKKKAIALRLWDDVEALLLNECVWYRNLVPLMPGFARILKDGNISDSLRQTMSYAFIPLELLQGTAVTYRVPDNPRWAEFCGISTRPFPISDESTLRSVDLEVKGARTDPMFSGKEFVFHPLQDPAIPMLASIMKSPAGYLLREHTQTLVINSDPSQFSRAEIVMDFRNAGNPSKLVILNINNSKFIATVRSTRKGFNDLNSAWVEQANYDGVLMMAINRPDKSLGGGSSDKVNPFTAMASLGKIQTYLKDMDAAMPQIREHIHHYVPISALVQGENIVRVTCFNGPSNTIDPVLYDGLRFLLSREK